MSLAKPIQFESFNDGVCEVYNTDDRNKISDLVDTYHYQNRTVGIQRYYTAMTASKKIAMLIRIPGQHRVDIEQRIVIKVKGKTDMVYEIIQIQDINDTHPKCTDLTLKKIGIKG